MKKRKKAMRGPLFVHGRNYSERKKKKRHRIMGLPLKKKILPRSGKEEGGGVPSREKKHFNTR